MQDVPFSRHSMQRPMNRFLSTVEDLATLVERLPSMQTNASSCGLTPQTVHQPGHYSSYVSGQ